MAPTGRTDDAARVVPTLVTVRALPGDLDVLVAAGAREGYRFLGRLRDDWIDARNRFDRPGERLVAARRRGTLVAVGGINVDPHVGDPRVGRLRHLYVSPGSRRSGVGRAVVRDLIDGARGTFDTVRLRVADEAGARFYERLGFVATGEPSASHSMVLSDDGGDGSNADDVAAADVPNRSARGPAG